MERRLYFLLPDRAHALLVVEGLNKSGISSEYIHALGDRRTRLDGLPASTLRQARDSASRLEKFLWNANLVSFALALCVFISLILTLNWNWWLLIPFVIMAANVLAGLSFTSLPNIHLGEFQDALAHGEILLMVDVRETEVAKVEQQVHHQHPEAAIGGVGWGSTALGL
jgi:hypothetical protein